MAYFNSANSSSLTDLKDRDSVSHDTVALNLKNLAKASDDYYVSYLKLCQAREAVKKAEQDLINMEQLCIKAKNDYDYVISRN